MDRYCRAYSWDQDMNNNCNVQNKNTDTDGRRESGGTNSATEKGHLQNRSEQLRSSAPKSMPVTKEMVGYLKDTDSATEKTNLEKTDMVNVNKKKKNARRRERRKELFKYKAALRIVDRFGAKAALSAEEINDLKWANIQIENGRNEAQKKEGLKSDDPAFVNLIEIYEHYQRHRSAEEQLGEPKKRRLSESITSRDQSETNASSGIKLDGFTLGHATATETVKGFEPKKPKLSETSTSRDHSKGNDNSEKKLDGFTPGHATATETVKGCKPKKRRLSETITIRDQSETNGSSGIKLDGFTPGHAIAAETAKGFEPKKPRLSETSASRDQSKENGNLEKRLDGLTPVPPSPAETVRACECRLPMPSETTTGRDQSKINESSDKKLDGLTSGHPSAAETVRARESKSPNTIEITTSRDQSEKNVSSKDKLGSLPLTRSSAADAVNTSQLLVVLVDRGFQQSPVTEDKWKIVELRLLDAMMNRAIANPGQTFPKFDNAGYLNNCKMLQCLDIFTKEWLIEEVSKLKENDLWSGARLVVIDRAQMQAAPKARVFIPKLVPSNSALSLLKRQNPDIPTDDWTVLQVSKPIDGDEGQFYLLQINKRAEEILYGRRGKMFWGLGVVFLRLRRRKNDRHRTVEAQRSTAQDHEKNMGTDEFSEMSNEEEIH